MTRPVVRVPTLRLELQKDRHPLVLRREVDYHSAVLPYAIVVDEPTRVALIHVDVVDAVARQKTEVLVLLVVLRSPAFAEGVDHSFLGGDCTLHYAVDLLVEIVINARHVERECAHLRAVEEICADVIESGCPGLTRDFGEAEGQFL